MRERIGSSLKKTLRGFFALLPIVLGMLLITSLAMSLSSVSVISNALRLRALKL